MGGSGSYKGNLIPRTAVLVDSVEPPGQPASENPAFLAHLDGNYLARTRDELRFAFSVVHTL